MKEKSKIVNTGKKQNKKKTNSIKTPKSSVKIKSNNANLIKELNSLVKEIDQEGISFLVKQAKVLIYNKKVEEHNKKIEKGVKITLKKPPFSDKLSMEIKEADDNSSFIFVINRARKFFTLEEMRKLVNICHLSKDEKDASHRLLAWFKNNRGDVLNDIGIEVSSDPALRTIYQYIVKRYKVKGR